MAVSEKIRFYTNGHPFLVSWICKLIDERGNRQWTVQKVGNAEKELLNNDNTLFDDMMKNIENNKELKQIVTEVLFERKKLLCAKSDPAINLGMMFGIFKSFWKSCKPSSKIGTFNIRYVIILC